MLFSKKTAAVLLAALMTVNTAVFTAFAAGTEEGENTSTVQSRSVTFKEVDEIVYTVDAVNVRTGPGLEYDVITTLKYGSAIRRTGIGDNGWSRVSYMGQDAYMYSPLLTTTDPTGGNQNTNTEADTSRLLRQIAIANGLKEENFTAASWANLRSALEHAENMRRSGTQAQVDEAAASLETAIAGLVTVDYSALDQAIANASQLVGEIELYGLTKRLNDALALAEELHKGGEQADVDAAAAEIAAILAQLEDYKDKPDTPEVIIQEVEVEVPPSGDYCNMGSHRIWPVAFAVSLVLNAILVILLVLVTKKKNYKAEDVPLVDYDIDDDI